MRLPQVTFGQSEGCEEICELEVGNDAERADFGVLELLFNIRDDAAARFADEGSIEQLRPDLARTRNSTRDSHEGADPIRPQVPNSTDKLQVVERHGKIPRKGMHAAAHSLIWVFRDKRGLVLRDKIGHRTLQVGHRAIILRRNGFR